MGLRIVFPGTTGLQTLPLDTVAWKDGKPKVFEFTPPNANREYLAVAHPVRVDGRVYGALVAAKPKAELLWASPRELLNIFQADEVGCHIITVTPDLLKKFVTMVGKPLDELSLDTVKMFYNDAAAAGFKL